MEHRILIIEDDPDIGALLRLHARECAGEVRLEPNGTRGLLIAQALRWDLIVLDWLLPGTDGIAICKQLRAQRSRPPILMLTARAAESDRVRGLDAGADDYVAKPFGVEEFKARIRVQLRRFAQRRTTALPTQPDQPLQAGSFRLDQEARVATLAGRALPLTAREFDLLLYFVRHPGRVFTREHLLRAIWGTGFDGYEHTVNSHINRLRSKLEPIPSTPRHIVTVWGLGYRFETGSQA
jgi:DNA-binding response OmpR family regulator